MFDLVHARIARDAIADQFAAGARRAQPETVAPKAPVRRSAVRILRGLADRLEPAPRPAPQA